MPKLSNSPSQLKKKRTSTKKASTVKADYQSTFKVAAEGKQKHGKSEQTRKNYSGHVRRGIEFLANFAREEQEAEEIWQNAKDGSNHLSAENENEIPTDSEAQMDPNFHCAFTGPPVRCTPTAIVMFMAHKCFTEERGTSTATAMHAAFLDHYAQMQGDKYRGRWKYDDAKKEWVGNPAKSATVEDMLDACKNKDGEGERKHSRAISIEDMRKLHDNYLKNYPATDPSCNLPDLDKAEDIKKRATYLCFNAMSTLAFIIWMRISEATSLQYKNLEFLHGRRIEGDFIENPDKHFFKVNLRNRKNWQKRVKSGEQQLNGHMYNIYPQDEPSIDAYTHLLNWLDFYEVLIGRPLQSDDYLFPTIGSNGVIHPERPMSPDIAQKQITTMSNEAGIHGAEFFTTHCFRRGGAQYRFMFAPIGKRWTLARIRWWGGWAQGEHRDTLIKYLLDELYTYEGDHCDALNPFDSQDPMVRRAGGEQGEVNPMCSLELRSRLEELQLQNETHQRRMEEKYWTYITRQQIQYDDLSHRVNNLSKLLTSLQDCPQALTSHSQHFSAQPTYRYHPYSKALIGPGIYPTSPREHPLRVDGCPQYNESPAADPPYHFSPTSCSIDGSIPSLSTPPPCRTTSLSPTCLSNLNGTRQSQHLRRGQGEREYSSQTIKHTVPELGRNLRGRAWEQIVEDWDHPDPSRSLFIAMKNWDSSFFQSKAEEVKFGQRQVIAHEFINVYNRDKIRFLKDYPESNKSFSALLKAIRAQRQENGECQIRRKKSN